MIYHNYRPLLQRFGNSISSHMQLKPTFVTTYMLSIRMLFIILLNISCEIRNSLDEHCHF